MTGETTFDATSDTLANLLNEVATGRPVTGAAFADIFGTAQRSRMPSRKWRRGFRFRWHSLRDASPKN
jgi:hypothetical protein